MKQKHVFDDISINEAVKPDKKEAVNFSRLIFTNEKGELCEGCIYDFEGFKAFTNFEKIFEKDHIFFRTADFEAPFYCFDDKGNLSRENVKSRFEMSSDHPNVLKCRFGEDSGTILIAKNPDKNSEIRLVKFFEYDNFKGTGIGGNVIQLLQMSLNKIVVQSNLNAMSFYEKYGFNESNEERAYWNDMVWESGGVKPSTTNKVIQNLQNERSGIFDENDISPAAPYNPTQR
jgi:hypothetical protein